MDMPMDEWGVRLCEKVDDALAAGDLAAARRLVQDGDGETRSLAKEYAMMVGGLGITIRVIADLAVATLERRPDADAADDMTALIRRFRQDIGSIYGVGVEPADGAAGEAAALPETYAACLKSFHEDQGALAREIVARIDEGDTEAARKVLRRRETDHYVPFHDRIVRFMADSFAWALRHYGEDELLRFQLDLAEGQRAGFEAWEKLPTAEFARLSAFLLKQHMSHVAVSEEADRFTIEMNPCGSGGRLRKSGSYAGEGGDLPFVEEAGPLTFGRERLPVYCTHCPIWNGSATLRWFGRAQWVFSDPARADGGCTVHLYKQAGYTPPDYAAKVALEEK